MKIPEDWDKPSPENERLCKKFEKGLFEYKNIKMPYRLFKALTKKKHPLVIFLHGADAVGRDNERHLALHDIGTMFAKERWQAEHPCHILAPQYNYGQHWSVDEVDEAVHELIKSVIEELAVNTGRIYIYGYSAGAVGTLRYIKEHRDLYTAAIAICGATSRSDIDNLKGFPLWMIHAADDEVVKASYKERKNTVPYNLGSRDIYEYLGKNDPMIQYTEYHEGYMQYAYGVNPHCSWVTVSDEKNEGFVRWMFSQG